MTSADLGPGTKRQASRILAVGDIHQALNLGQIESAINCIRPDITIFLGDYFDSFVYDHHDHVRRTAIWLKRGIRHPDRVYLLGNHDLPYAYPHLVTCPGWTPEKHRVVRTVLEEVDWAKFHLSYAINSSWLFTHAGVSRSLVPAGLKDIPAWLSEQEHQGLCCLKQRQPHWIFKGGTRRGEKEAGGPLWCDLADFEPIDGLNQVFGHTPAKKDEHPIRRSTGIDSINFCIDAMNSDRVIDLLLIDNGIPKEIPLSNYV
ncbi:hypothetical protein CMV30_15045 [Nibricoccus aquaticus]|uniref:Calcineurin-like phosphoesterase domain-containing protein n=1 Tax=Nibricoccus aquaticus TaxID=2576891 RepID=A0A290Q9Q4_9BACT|nr:metallophosphoesterase [Nibricoccus aquaticus]ATC65163.1 hypothetical protein CMV30_15045 [Nibricoccus aquaticus]